jgi:hypothetical protein
LSLALQDEASSAPSLLATRERTSNGWPYSFIHSFTGEASKSLQQRMVRSSSYRATRCGRPVDSLMVEPSSQSSTPLWRPIFDQGCDLKIQINTRRDSSHHLRLFLVTYRLQCFVGKAQLRNICLEDSKHSEIPHEKNDSSRGGDS